MALLPLATAADLDEYGYDTAAETYLARASTRVRRYTGQEITAGTSTVTLSSCPYRLPQRPVTAVTAVTDVDDEPVEYTLGAAGMLKLSGRFRFPVTVEYNHGYADLPDELVELVCSIAARMSRTPEMVAAGARTEQAGGEAVTWGSDAFGGTTGLTQKEQDELTKLFPKLPTTVRLKP